MPMVDCGCESARARLEDYLHGELAQQDCCDMEDHLKACQPCGDEHSIGKTLTLKVKSACCETAPEDLKRQIMASLEKP